MQWKRCMLRLQGVNKKKLIQMLVSVFTLTLIVLMSLNCDVQQYIRSSIEFLQIDANVKYILFRPLAVISSICNIDFILSTIIIIFNMLFTISSFCVFVIVFHAHRPGIIEKVEYSNEDRYIYDNNYASNDVYLINGQFLC